MNYKTIRYVLSWVLKIEAFCMILPLICAIVYKEHNIWIWLFTIAMCFFSGVLLCKKPPQNKTIYAKDGFVAVALSWIVLSIFGAFPLFFTGSVPSFINALFETVSGFTTTGASVIADLDALPKSIIFWRSFTHWIGGMGVLVFLVALLPLTGSGNFFLIKAESPGPAVSKLVPRVKTTAKILYIIYIGLTVLQVILLLCGGMKLFDAITLTFGTAGTGGFGISNAGFSVYSSYCQIVITVFMIIFGIDFSIYHLIIMRKFRTAFKSDEVRTYLGIILASVVIICFNCRHLYTSLFDTVKHSAFQVASIITTTGYTTVDFNLWPELSKSLLVLLMFFGACAGSTGGGIKISRVMIMFKSIIKEVRILAHPKSTLKIKMNGRAVEHETVRAVNVFMMAYILIFAMSMLVISLDNLDFTTNFTAVAATINNVGPGLGAVGPMANFSVYSPLSLFVLICDMLIGRLEIFPLLLLVSPYTWKK
ncbi:MAG: TrkH family potassium uptake protein [Clostridia bacterium]|nr:TrkH family potassium uptake protein [Clostridia bacterium]